MVNELMFRDSVLTDSIELEFEGDQANHAGVDTLADTVFHKMLHGGLGHDESVRRFRFLLITVGLRDDGVAALAATEELARLPVLIANVDGYAAPDQGAVDERVASEIVGILARGIDEVATLPTFFIDRVGLESLLRRALSDDSWLPRQQYGQNVRGDSPLSRGVEQRTPAVGIQGRAAWPPEGKATSSMGQVPQPTQQAAWPRPNELRSDMSAPPRRLTPPPWPPPVWPSTPRSVVQSSFPPLPLAGFATGDPALPSYTPVEFPARQARRHRPTAQPLRRNTLGRWRRAILDSRRKRAKDKPQLDPGVQALEEMAARDSEVAMLYLIQVAGRQANNQLRKSQRAFASRLGQRMAALADDDAGSWFVSVIDADAETLRVANPVSITDHGINVKGSHRGYDFSLGTAARELLTIQASDAALVRRRGSQVRRTIMIFLAPESPLVDSAGLHDYQTLCDAVDACRWIIFGDDELPVAEALLGLSGGAISAHPDIAEQVFVEMFQSPTPALSSSPADSLELIRDSPAPIDTSLGSAYRSPLVPSVNHTPQRKEDREYPYR